MTCIRCSPARIAAAPLAAALALSCSPSAPEPAPVVRPVRTQVAHPAAAGRTRTFSGAARAGIESRLSFKVAGTVSRVAVSVGDSVARGDLLMALDPSDYQLRVQEGEAALAQAEAAARAAAAEYERVRGLYENRNTSRSHLDASRAQSESAQAQVDGARNRLALARAQVGYCTISAPRPGTVSDVAVEVNENVRAGQVVAEIASGERPEVEVAVPEVSISRIEAGASAEVRFPALPERAFPARVIEVGVTSGATATTFPVRLRLERPEAAIRPGMAAEATFRFAGRQDTGYFLDPVAVGEDRDGRYVFVVEATGNGQTVARRRPVEVGELTAAGLEILTGVSEGERVVTAGVRRLSDGLRVRVLEDDE